MATRAGSELANEYIFTDFAISETFHSTSGYALLEGVDENTPVIYYIMRARDPDCITPTYRTWTVVGTPDTDGSLYDGVRCGATPLTDIVVVKKVIT